jgi:hypothetical protein
VLWLSHFLLVYLVVEAGCTGDGPGLDALDPPVSDGVTVLVTAVAAFGCLVCVRSAFRRWRAPGQVREAAESGDPEPAPDEHVRATAFAGFLLALLSFVAVLFVGLPALYLSGC